MTWPTTPISTNNLDAGSDEPRLARADLKQTVDQVNAMRDEFGNVAIASATTDQLIQKTNNGWVSQHPKLRAFTERTANIGVVNSGTLTVDFSAGPVQYVYLGGDVTLATANTSLPDCNSVSLWVRHTTDGNEVTWPVTTLSVDGDRNLSVVNGRLDLIHISTVNIFNGNVSLVTVVRNWV
jgi:hypothetical protein